MSTLSPDGEDKDPVPTPSRGPEPARPEAIDALPRTLGFDETLEMASLREALVAKLLMGEDVRVGAVRYHELAAGPNGIITVQYPDTNSLGYRRAQIGLIVTWALMWRDAGNTEECERELSDAITLASDLGCSFPDIVDVLRKSLEPRG